MRPQLEKRKSQMGKLTGKSKHTVKVGNHPHTHMIPKPATMRRGEYQCRKWELHLKLRDQQIKTTLCVCIYIYIYIYIYTHIHRERERERDCYIKTSW